MRKGIKCVQLQKSRLPRRHYRTEIPNDCRNCSFWLDLIDNCSRYECFYLISEVRADTNSDDEPGLDCGRCPYGRIRPCVGYCIAKLYRETISQKR